MREIKFKIWDIKNKEMGKIFTLKDAIQSDAFEVNVTYIFLQFTGLLDKNRKEIFEGDIVKVKMYSGKFENYKVIWDKKEACWDSINKKRDNWISPTVWKKSKVIGNIYEGIKIY